MTDLRIDTTRAERLAAQVLRDNGQSPEAANKLAAAIVTRMLTSQAMPVKPGLRGFRMISETLPYERREGFEAEVSKLRAKAPAEEFWKLVYSYGRHVPDDIVI